ncbi:TonB-dependent receptor [Edaphobacter dinghuensis]|nr:carboxypeptidase regulatory-like domain-containing protein [Edaphobacter dinghuensis]
MMILLCMPFANAQENATLNGTATDPSGAVVPNASVKLVNAETNESHTTVTNGSGIFNFTGLGIGHYTLTVTASGFQVSSTSGIVLNVAQTLQENVVLSVGSSQQTVSVEANALRVQTETSEVSNLISGSQVSELATNGRNITALAVLGTGVSNNLPDYNGVNALTAGNGISFNGTRPSHNIYLVDGGEIYDRGCGGCFSILVSQDAISQFQTLNSNYSPDYGIGSGGQILMVLKSGAQRFHGGIWEFNRNDAFDANNYITKLNGSPKPELRVNIFGGNIGGPLFIPHLYNQHRDRTFFFFNEEGRREIRGSAPTRTTTIPASDFPTAGQALVYTPPSSGTVPVVPVTNDPAKLALYSADHLTPGSPFPNNTIPANLLDPNAVLFMGTGAFPKPNSPDGTNTFVASISAPTYVREDLVRIDHAINSKLQLMGHYIHDANTQTKYPPLWSNDSYPTVGSVMNNPAWAAVVKLTQTISPNLLNETAFNFDGNKLTFTPVGTFAQPTGWNAGSFFTGNNALNRLPEIDLGAPYGTTWSSQYFPWKNAAMDYQTRDDLSWSHGAHNFKFGFSYMHFIKNQQLQFNTQGTYGFTAGSYSGDSYVNFLLGFANSYTQLQALNTPHWVNNTYSFYVLDNWKPLRRLALNLGIRYDALPHAFERNNRFANFVPSDYNTSYGNPFNADGSTLNPSNPGFSQPAGAPAPFYLNGVQIAGVNGFPRGAVKNPYNTVQPRLGFAYDITGNGKTVIRGGIGIFFERIQGNDVYNAGGNPPFSYQPAANNVYFSSPTKSNQTGQAAAAAIFPASLTNLAYNYPAPGVAMYSLGVQREVAPSIVGVLQYVGTSGWHQNDDRAINTLPLNTSLSIRQAVAGGTVSPNQYRQYLGYAGITQEEQTTNANYNSLQAGLRVENRRGFTVQVSYTWSHEIDLANSDLTTLSNPFNPTYDRASGSLDERHIFSTNYIYTVPFFKNGNLLERQALSGWQISGITIANTGTPVSVGYGTDTIGLGGGTTNRANRVVGVSTSGPKTQKKYFNTAAFMAPIAAWATGSPGGVNAGFGTSGKDAVVGPGRFNTNFTLFKSFPLIGEALRLQIRADVFNAFNHTQFQNLDSGFTDSNFGQATSAWDARSFQFGGKLLF